MNEEMLRRRIAGLGFWYHNLELAPGVWTNPAMGDYPRLRWNLIEPYLPADLTGKTVLDLSCNSGFFSVEMKRRGARRVVGVERYGPAVEQARLVREATGVDFEIVHDDVMSFCWTNTETFDYVLFMGLFYHLRAPLFVLDRVALLVKEKLFFQTVVRGDDPAAPPLQIPPDIDVNDHDLFRHPSFPRAVFIEGTSNGGDTSNWWFVNSNCLHAMLRSAGFTRYTQVSGDTFVCDPPPDLTKVPDYGTKW
jgi:tRNA (mo5U34)-methyltransferase